MVSLQTIQAVFRSTSTDTNSSPRISFSSDFLDDNDFITISPNKKIESEKDKVRNAEFEFLSSHNINASNMTTADELFFEGKLLPFWQTQQSEKLNKINICTKENNSITNNKREEEIPKKDEPKMNWFIDDDPSPRPPKCTVLWKELLRLKKSRPNSSLSPSSSSSSTSSSSSSLADAAIKEEEKPGNKDKHAKRIKKGLERTRSGSIRIRPMINLPIYTSQVKTKALPPLFPLRKGRMVDR